MQVPTSGLIAGQEDIAVERAQATEEGRDISALEPEFAALDRPEVGEDPALTARAGRLLDAVQRAPFRPDYPYDEPSDIRSIQAARPPAGDPAPPPTDRAALLAKAHGAWLGRCCGCQLGKPVEGRPRPLIEKYLRSQGRWPLADYFSEQVSDAVAESCWRAAPGDPSYIENMACMPEDDDTNYTTLGLTLMEARGAELRPVDVAVSWLRHLPINHTFTAERVAYRNLVNLLHVPDNDGRFEGEFSAATYRNPYREWIGAQIRGDFFGYCRPGDPAGAAELAWRDGCISHVRNGIYGEMWVAAMLAAAYGLDDVQAVVRAGLGQIPARCRLRGDIEQVFAWRAEGRGRDEALAAIHERWDESFRHHWCHTNSNAQIVVVALLWGGMDFGRTICTAVEPGFDTDCNGATAGSVLGMVLGRDGIPSRWADPLRDTLRTGVHGFHEVRISDMAERTVKIIERHRDAS